MGLRMSDATRRYWAEVWEAEEILNLMEERGEELPKGTFCCPVGQVERTPICKHCDDVEFACSVCRELDATCDECLANLDSDDVEGVAA